MLLFWERTVKSAFDGIVSAGAAAAIWPKSELHGLMSEGV
jgi:hypothetical protein